MSNAFVWRLKLASIASLTQFLSFLKRDHWLTKIKMLKSGERFGWLILLVPFSFQATNITAAIEVSPRKRGSPTQKAWPLPPIEPCISRMAPTSGWLTEGASSTLSLDTTATKIDGDLFHARAAFPRIKYARSRTLILLVALLIIRWMLYIWFP